ncbi:MAG: agmatine deiminase [Verrucomicrobia bacterium RIFCSPHIGHO2_12_FULL_41_10]|nr:MAG: agmatine deiminase [Verrucomicrobia bacterium RIFCSPHIGHO2_12_FULL_41_10]
MPAEWERHEATWISWPHREGVSFPGYYDAVIPTFVAMAKAIGASEILRINVRDGHQEQEIKKKLSPHIPSEHLEFYKIKTQEPWCRDHGPIFVRCKKTGQLIIIDWNYNAWGEKYLPFDDDNAVPSQIADLLDLSCFKPNMILEGGSIDVNGAGALLTTESCLLNKNRNPTLSRQEIEIQLKHYLGVNQIIWLGDGIEGDDTDGHIDDITRFVAEATVITVVEENKSDPNHLPLQKNRELLQKMTLSDGRSLNIVELPMPPGIEREGQRLPASYANFYITNHSVLLPTFAVSSDKTAIGILTDLFPTRTIIPIDCRELIWGLGAFHCLTQQQPVAIRPTGRIEV